MGLKEWHWKNTKAPVLPSSFSVGHLSCPWVHIESMATLSPLLTWNNNKLPDISPTKLSLFGISREVQSVCNYDEPHASLPRAREGTALIEGKRMLGRLSKQRAHGFSLVQSLPGKKSSPVVLGYGCRVWELPLLVCQLCNNWGFCLLIFCNFELMCS